MDTLQAAYRDVDEASTPPPLPTTTEDGVATINSDALASETKLEFAEFAEPENDRANAVREEPENAVSEDFFSDETSNYGTPLATDADRIDALHSSKFPPETDRGEEEDDDGADEEEPPPKKQKQLSDLPKPEIDITEMPSPADIIIPLPLDGKAPAAKSGKKLKRKSKDVWTTTSRKGKKKIKHASNNNHNPKNPTGGYTSMSDKMLITPIPRFPDRSDDSPDLRICLSKVYKAEKVELSEDRLRAASTKGYRMVRATRGVTEGAWYFEIKVMHLGDTGHTRLGWSTDKGDLQAPVGYDGNSYGYRDIDGSKVHKALREKYGEEGYKEGDVIGVYINLPDGDLYAPNPPCMAWYKGQRYVSAPAPGAKEDPLKVVPGSEISFFKNGIGHGVAYRDLYGGCYYPAASMYTLPNQPNCVVKFNFGPGFERFPDNFGERRVPRPVIEVPYQGEKSAMPLMRNHFMITGSPWKIPRMSPFKLVKNDDSLVSKVAEMVG